MNSHNIPISRHTVDEEDISSVAKVLRSDFLSQGPKVEEFEMALAEYCHSPYAVVYSSGTLALLAAYDVAGLTDKTSFVTSPLTFPATINAGLWLGAKPLFADIDPETGNIDVSVVEEKIQNSTKALVVVDFAGHPVEYDELRGLAKRRQLVLISDAAHSLGALYKNQKVGNLAALTVFSFHPVKSITTGEGGAVLTNQKELYERLKEFRNHGMRKTADYYEIISRGINARLTDIQAALGISQLKKLDRFLEQRRRLAHRYLECLQGISLLILPVEKKDARSAWHLFIVRLQESSSTFRWSVIRQLRQLGIGAQVHYPLVYQHPYFKKWAQEGTCPEGERFAASCISLPLYPTLTDNEQDQVIEKLLLVLERSQDNARTLSAPIAGASI